MSYALELFNEIMKISSAIPATRDMWILHRRPDLRGNLVQKCAYTTGLCAALHTFSNKDLDDMCHEGGRNILNHEDIRKFLNGIMNYCANIMKTIDDIPEELYDKKWSDLLNELYGLKGAVKEWLISPGMSSQESKRKPITSVKFEMEFTLHGALSAETRKAAERKGTCTCF